MELDNEFDGLQALIEAAEQLDESENGLTKKEDAKNRTETIDSSILPSKYIEDVNFLKSSDTVTETENLNEKNKSLVHNGDTDSSDDEDNRNHDSKYNQFGKDIKTILFQKEQNISNNIGKLKKSLIASDTKDNRNVSNTLNNTNYTLSSHDNKTSVLESNREFKKTNELSVNSSADIKIEQKKSVYYDPIFGLRISNPLVSSAVLKERMNGREAISFNRLKYHIERGNTENDWVIGAVIVSKTDNRTSQNGNQYSIWTLSDLKDNLKTVSLFLFKSACKALWKTTKGTAVAILNPSVMDKKKGSKDEACLSINNAQQVMILGPCKDLGFCKSKKKNGENCTAFVNVNRCEYCIHHVQLEYQKCSRRPGLQSDSLIGLRNKVLGKNEVFYAGKSYTAIPARKSKKLVERDEGLLKSLSGQKTLLDFHQIKQKPAKRVTAAKVEIPLKQRMKDLERLKKLGVTFASPSPGASSLSVSDSKQDFNGVLSKEVSIEDSKTLAINTISKLKEKQKLNVASKNLNYQKSVKSSLSDENNMSGVLKLDECDSINLTDRVVQKPSTSGSVSQNSSEEKQKHMVSVEINTPGILKSDYESNPINFTDDQNVQMQSMIKSNNKPVNDNKSKLNVESNCFDESESRAAKMLNRKLSQTTINDYKVNSNVKFDKPMSNFSAKDVLLHNTLLSRSPTLTGNSSGTVDLSFSSVNRKTLKHSKSTALEWVKRNGPIKKIDPMNLKGRGLHKRVIENLETPDAKRQKHEPEALTIRSERFKKVMEAKSNHCDLIEQHAEEAKEKYFDNLERKEQMEEKMLSTFKIECKAVRCLTCKYTNFSASNLCKTERHPLKVFDAFKRFFKCAPCGNRIVTLEIIPLTACSKCGESKWVKSSMCREKTVKVGENLSIRGGEEKFMGSVVTDANINLMVPD